MLLCIITSVVQSTNRITSFVVLAAGFSGFCRLCFILPSINNSPINLSLQSRTVSSSKKAGEVAVKNRLEVFCVGYYYLIDSRENLCRTQYASVSIADKFQIINKTSIARLFFFSRLHGICLYQDLSYCCVYVCG